MRTSDLADEHRAVILPGFQDGLSRPGYDPGYDEEIEMELKGRDESGMTGRYGTKKQPRAVKIAELNEAVQNLKWLFFGNLRSTCAR